MSDSTEIDKLVVSAKKGDIVNARRLLVEGCRPSNCNRKGKFPLLESCTGGLTKIVRLLLEYGAQVDQQSQRKRLTALMLAIQNDHTDVIQVLLEHDAQVDLQDKNGFTALMCASENGESNSYFEVVQLLLRHSSSVNLQNDYGESALMFACQNGKSANYMKVIKLLLENDAEADVQDNDGWSALIHACQNGDCEHYYEVVELLLESGAKTDCQNDDGMSALMFACQNENSDNYLKVVKILIEHKAQIDIQNNNGDTALILAAQNGTSHDYLEVCSLLLQKGAGVNLQNNDGLTALLIASQNGKSQYYFNLIETLLKHGANVNFQNSDGETALMLVLSQIGEFEPSIRAIKLLLQHGAEVNNDEESALMLATQNRDSDFCFEAIKLLLENNAIVDLQNREGESALTMALNLNDNCFKIVKALIDNGANVNIQTFDADESALMVAIQRDVKSSNYVEVIELLIECGADVDHQDSHSKSALILAIGNTDASFEVVKILLEFGAEVDLQDDDGLSALMYALTKEPSRSQYKTIELLLHHGANVDLQSSILQSVLRRKNSEIIKLLVDHDAVPQEHLEVIELEDSPDQDSDSLEDISCSPHESSQASNEEHLEEYVLDEEEQLHLSAVEKAIKDGGTLDHTLAHGVFVGPPRSGKDSLMKRLLGEMPSDLSPSTGAAEKIIHVKVEKFFTFAATVEDSKWTKLEYDEEALQLLKSALSNSENTIQEEPYTDRVFSPECMIEDGTEESVLQVHAKELSCTKESDGLQTQVRAAQISQLSSPNQHNVHKKINHKSPMEIFKEAMKNKGIEGLKTQLEASWSFYLTNTGGQIEFQELLPLLVSGPSIFFITFQLHKDIRKTFSVEYELPDGKVSKSYQSSLSVLEAILHTLSSIAAMGTFVYKGLHRKQISLRPKVFFVGTHKDLLDRDSVSAQVKGIDTYLQKVIRSTSHFHNQIIEFCSESQMIFTVNNLDPDDSDFLSLRSAVEKVVDKGDYKMSSPAHWMIFSLVIRKLKNNVVSYDKCFEVAKECGIQDEEQFKEALQFIHTKMGIIRYFFHHDLKDLVIIDPQILFDKVTELIIETFTFENVHMSTLETFKKMGIFSLSDFARINDRIGKNLTPKIFAKILEHLRIAAPFQEDGEIKYFLPCVLSHAEVNNRARNLTLQIPPLIVTFKCGYCPKGLPGSLITYLITNEMKYKFSWELMTDQVFRDEVSFQVSPYDTITIRILPTHLEITCAPSSPSVQRNCCTEEEVCMEVLQAVEKGIETVTSAINYVNAQHSFTFYCTSDICSENCHPAKLLQYKGKMGTLRCEKQNRYYPLPLNYEKWQLDSRKEIILYQITNERLTNYHCPSHLISQLSNCAPKWREIGTHLGFDQNELDAIQARPLLLSGAPQTWLSDLISCWLEWTPGDCRGSVRYANLEDLRSTLHKTGYKDIADKLLLLDQQGTTDNISQSLSTGIRRVGSSTEEEAAKRPRLD